MLQKVFVFLTIALLYGVGYLILLFKKRDTGYLFFSFVVTSIPFQMSVPIFTPAYLVGPESGTGTFSGKLFLTIPLVASFFLLASKKGIPIFQRFKNERWIYYTLLLSILSLVNPDNYARWATIGFGVLFLSYILFFKINYYLLSPLQVLNGIYTSLAFLALLQFILAIMFPLLNLSFVTAIFQSGGSEWATREGVRAGAIGVFVTPANLGLYTTIASAFFLITYLSGYKQKISLFLLVISMLTIWLTYSRTSYITLVFVLFLVYYLYNNARKPLFSFKSIFLGFLPALLVLYLIVFYSPLSDVFLKTNADEMYQARMDHWLIGLRLFRASPLIGVGINTHLEFIHHNFSLYKEIHNDFLTSNPIHNTHLIVLAETGVTGFILWIIFLFSSVSKAKLNVAGGNNVVFCLTQVGLLICYVIYGFTDWAPLSPSIFPLFILFTFYSKKYSW